MQLRDIKAPKGANKKRRRVGRGPGSGLGKTAGYGMNGQKATSGGVKAPGFTGGQTPMAIRFPKRGFKRYGRKTFAEINVGQLSKAAAGAELTAADLRKQRMIEDVRDGLRVLGGGEIKVAVTIHANHFSKSAKAKIEAAGGKAVVLP